MPAAIQSEAVPLARLGFLAQGLLCLALLAAAIRAIRVGNTSLHARLMLQMSATIFGAVLLRVMLALAARAGLPFDAAYGAIAWLSWLLPFAIVSAWPRFREIPSTQRGAHEHSWRVSCAHGNRHGMKFNRECANSYAPSTSSAAPDQTSKIAFQRVPKVKEF